MPDENNGDLSAERSVFRATNSSDLPLREYSVWFDPWVLRFAEVTLSGLANRQDVGGLRIVSFELRPDEDALAVVVEHHGNDSVPRIHVGHRIVLSKIRAMARDDDPGAGAGIYLDDLTDPSVPPGIEPVGGVYWITQPPV